MTALFTSGMFCKKALILACPRAHCSVMPLAMSKTAWVWRPQGGPESSYAKAMWFPLCTQSM